MSVHVYAYDADGRDQQVNLTDIDDKWFGKHKLLWVDVCGSEKATLDSIVAKLGHELAAPLGEGLDISYTPQNYGAFLRFAVDCAPRVRDRGSEANQDEIHFPEQEKRKVAFYVSENWLVTLHEAEVNFLTEFHEQDRGETLIGLLSPASLTASLLDWCLSDFFDAVTAIAAAVDVLDERVLRETASRTLLGRIVALRRRTARLRETLGNCRVVFYGLGRPDLLLVAGSESAASFQNLVTRFERALDEVERARDLINGSFELFSSRSSLQTNTLVKVLTIVTAVLGYIGATAGLFGMNLKSSLFEGGDITFAVIVLVLISTSLGAILFARYRRWI